ncbi:hypothetical protein BDM02DRAFT_1749187 [Thelephora ganbajun]|uniref:Uncharacterized protein n=1 Tax=Thelephora ganbajun TaxID=370292 RepID=A0ACB6ZKC3_THEGA|nr:hypothetical protein BDM02DRAFT_1749187 [Thelephora ganbajun]
MLPFLSRIRHRGSNTQPPTHSVSPPPAPASLDTTLNREVPIDGFPSPLVGLKIRPDLNSLLESYETEDLNPSHQGKEGSASVPSSLIQDGYNPLSPKPNISRNAWVKSPELILPMTPISTGQPTFPTFTEASPLGGTFGRQQPPLTNLGSVGSGLPYHKAPTRSRSFGDTAKTDQTATSIQGSGWNLTPTNKLPLSGTFERSSSVRSLPDKKRRIDRRRGANTRSFSSLRTDHSSRSSPATPHPSQKSPLIVHQSSFESPRTFGHPTPPYSTRTFGHNESPPPPLPPLDLPELIHDARGLRSVTFGRSHGPSNSATSIPRVDNIFGIPQELTSSRKPVTRKQSKTLSVDSRGLSRRSSAEWSAVRATEGILTNSNSWQAQVSREILRLSLGESAASPGTGDPGNNRDVSHVSATRHPPAETFVSPCPPSLGSSLLLQDPTSPPGFCGGDQAAVTGDEHGEHRGMTEQGTPTLQVANGPSDTKGKQPLKSSLRASSRPQYSAISTVLATPARSDDSSSDSGVTKGKRKADEDPTSSDQRSLHAKFAVPEDLPLGKHSGSDLHAPSSFRAKRARLSTSSHSPGPSPSRPDTSLNATNTSTWTSTTSSKMRPPSRQQSVTKPSSSKTNSYRSDIPSEKVRSYERTRSMSQLSHTSIPVSALVSPRAPSVGKSLTSTYHMRDPRKPPRVQPTPWGLRLRTEVEDGSPIHAWFFFLGFIIFPLWWFASVWRIPRTRSVGGSEVEKAVTLDDPQVEHDARTWRFRCRIMAGVSLITYIPFIVLVSIFAR